MKRAHWWTTGLLLVASLGTAQAQKPVDLEVQFKAAERKELVDGDLKGAIEQYRQIVAKAGTNRSVAAKALLRMAECYQKQGDVEARKIYERLVRDFADQRDAASIAQARLGNASSTDRVAAMSLRKLSTTDVFGAVSYDGRYLTYVDWIDGNLMLRDLATGSERPVTGLPPGSSPKLGDFAEESAISRDGAQVAFTWYDAASRRYELRVTSTKGPGVQPARRLISSEEIPWIAPVDWSPDGQQIVVWVQRRDQISQIALVQVVDGALRVLKTVDWRGPTKVFFSPDGRFLGYDLPKDGTRQRDVYVLAVDGSRETAAVMHSSNDVMMGWSPDGKQLLFASDRNGEIGLFAQPVDDGKVSGSVEVLHANIGSSWSMGLTARGSLFLGIGSGGQDIEVATVDFSSGKRLAAPARPIQRFAGVNLSGTWSQDGKYLAYKSSRGLSAKGRDAVIGVLTLETGEVRDVVPQGLQDFHQISWAPDRRLFAVSGMDLKGRQGVFQVDAQTGAVEPIHIPPADLSLGRSFQHWASDGKHLYYRRRSEGGIMFVERDPSTGADRDMLPKPIGGNPAFSVSPDGQWLAVIETEQGTRATRCVLFPVVGGSPKEILRVAPPQSLQPNIITWSPDSRGVIVRRMARAGSGESELLFVPATGAAPIKLDVDATNLSTPEIHVHPDGKRIAFTSGQPSSEIWVLENFLPRKASKP